MEGFPKQEQPIEEKPSLEVVESSETVHASNLMEVGKAWSALDAGTQEAVVPATKEEALFMMEKLEELKNIVHKAWAVGEKEAFDTRFDAFIEKLKEVK